MDPGNWATCIAGGSKFGYSLLGVVFLSNLMAMLLQALSARLGIVSGRDLAQACREYYPPAVGYGLWVLCEVAIIACDLAEVIGTALAMKLLFGIPMGMGAVLTVLDSLLVLLLMRRGFRWLEAFIFALILLIAACFMVQLAIASPHFSDLFGGFLNPTAPLKNSEMLYISIGILGATVMPHNLYLHSSIVQTRAFERNDEGRRHAIGWATLDSTLALGLALFVNAAILVLSGAVFYSSGRTEVAEIQDAYQLLSPLLGTSLAATLFGIALLASGLNSTVTGTLAGQIVMEGFLRLRLKPWVRRLLTRGLAVVPVVVVTALYGEHGTSRLLVLSQVVLSMQLPFAVIPLVGFVSSRKIMGTLAIPGWLSAVSWLVAGGIVALNLLLLRAMW
ncbi:MAG: manganese transport protein [Verrucomicrobia bacterium]|nr:MAG: manganese transport protein [Verrucomicrobiota bacterium]